MAKTKLTPQQRDLLLKRRERITSLWARGLSQREIQAAMANPKSPSFMLNPQTSEPYDLATVNRDLKYVRARHEQSINESLEEHKAAQSIEIKELRRAAWNKGDLKSVAQALKLEMELTGTISTKIDVNLKRKPTSAKELTIEELEAFIAEYHATSSSDGTAETAQGSNESA